MDLQLHFSSQPLWNHRRWFTGLARKAVTVHDGTSREQYNDVVIRQTHGNRSTAYLLGTPAAPDQFILRTRDEAVSQALAYSKHRHVQAWLAKDDEDFVLLGTFRDDAVRSARLS